tara:strand:- start:482 stop:835 length:354 start_codon:yes stop_codon:yes gene_type:complete
VKFNAANVILDLFKQKKDRSLVLNVEMVCTNRNPGKKVVKNVLFLLIRKNQGKHLALIVLLVTILLVQVKKIVFHVHWVLTIQMKVQFVKIVQRDIHKMPLVQSNVLYVQKGIINLL